MADLDDPPDTDRTRGVYRKFKVTRADGSHRKGRKHHACTYYVLDLEHDEFALPALAAYAKACRKTHPELAANLEAIIATRPCNCREAMCSHTWAAQTPNAAMQEALTDG